MTFHSTQYLGKTGDFLNCIKSSLYLIEKSQFPSEGHIIQHKEISLNFYENRMERANTLCIRMCNLLNIAAGDYYS
jgi:hypothetical protein